MFKYNKTTHIVQIFCPKCQETISFNIPENLFKEDQIEYPFTFRYIHGTPPHSVTLYIDKRDDIRGHEFGDSVQFSDEIVEKIIQDRVLEQDKESAIILKSIFDTYTAIIQAKIPTSVKKDIRIGQDLNIQLQSLFNSRDHVIWEDKIMTIRKKGDSYIISDNEGDVFEFDSKTNKRKELSSPVTKISTKYQSWSRIVSKDGNVGFNSKNIYVGVDYIGKAVQIKHINEKFVVFYQNKIIKEQNVDKTVGR